MGHRRSKEDEHRLKKLHEETKHSYGAGAYYDSHAHRLKKYSCNNKEFRQYTNRKYRRIKTDEYTERPADYRKHKQTEYWWIII